jgi:hypothetical protein
MRCSDECARSMLSRAAPMVHLEFMPSCVPKVGPSGGTGLIGSKAFNTNPSQYANGAQCVVPQPLQCKEGHGCAARSRSTPRIEDLGPGNFIRVECIACGHNEMVPTSGLLIGLRLPPSTPHFRDAR